MSPKVRGSAGLFLPCKLGAPAQGPRRSLRALPRPAGLAMPYRLGGPSSSAARRCWVLFALPRWPCRTPKVPQSTLLWTHWLEPVSAAALAVPPRSPPDSQHTHRRRYVFCRAGPAGRSKRPTKGTTARTPLLQRRSCALHVPCHCRLASTGKGNEPSCDVRTAARQSCTMRAPVPQQTRPLPGWLQPCVAAAL